MGMYCKKSCSISGCPKSSEHIEYVVSSLDFTAEEKKALQAQGEWQQLHQFKIYEP